MKNFLYVSLYLLVIMSCKNDKTNEISQTAGEIKPIIFEGINHTIKPGDNFYNHVNKIWYDNAVIADDQVGVGSYRFLNIPQQELLQNILEEVSQKSHPKGSIEQKVGDFYASGMDTISINKRGVAPIQPILDKIEAINNKESVIRFVATQMQSGDYSIISPYISPDQEDSSINMLHFAQTGLGLPDRDYYFAEDPSVKSIQEAYKTYLTKLFELIGDDNAKGQADIVYTIEKQLAISHKTRVQRRIIKENYHKMAVSDLQKKHPNIGWVTMLDVLGADVDSVDIAQPDYYNTLNSMLTSVPLEDWKLFLKANSISSHDNILSKPFQDASFEYSKVLSGQSTQQSRSKQMVRRVDGQIGFDLGQLYVKRYFNEDAKKRALDLVNNFQKVLEKRISDLDWMSDSTKVKAIDKLHSINKKIGYPDVWRTYDVTINRDQFF